MKKYFVLFLLIMAFIDGIWLYCTADYLYRPALSHILAKETSLLAVAVFYVLYSLGAVFFVVLPQIKLQTGLLYIFLQGAFFGAVSYGTFDLTNQAIIADWPVLITIIDILWGAVLTGATSALTLSIIKIGKSK